MNQPQHDMQAHGEQIRHAQYLAEEAAVSREERAAETAFIALAEMDGNDLLDMIANNNRLDARMVLLIERIAMLGMPSNNSCYADDVVRFAKALYDAMLEVVTEQRVKDCK